MDQELKQYLDEKFAEVPTKTEFRALETKVDAIQTTLERIDKRDKEDSDAFAKIAVKHDQRITTVEKDIKALKLHHAS